MSTSRLCYSNLLENGTVAASSENTSFPVGNCLDWNTADYFKPAAGGTINIDLTLSVAQPADYFAYFNQDLYLKSGTIKLQYWNGSSYVDCFSAVSPTDSTPQVKFFTAQSSTKWRIVIVCATVFSLGVVSFGQNLPMQYGMYLNWTDPIFARATKVSNNISETGVFLGRSIEAKGILTTLILQYAADSWMRTNWIPFVKRIEQKPFFWVPDADNHPTEAVFCWTESEITPPTHTHYKRMGTEIQLRGLIE